jgi:hypothetical protein
MHERPGQAANTLAELVRMSEALRQLLRLVARAIVHRLKYEQSALNQSRRGSSSS